MGDTVKIVDRGSAFGAVWVIGWLFTIGFVKLSFGKAVLGLCLWPYFLGAALSAPR
ncbi:MAG: hypothetical protein ACT4PE_18530 [Candidatus Eiseniibacteriota bacterium]